MAKANLTRFAWLSIFAAMLTIALKAAAYYLTGSVGLLSDALESVVNLVAAIIALVTLTVAVKPSDEEHAYGHSKAEYFSSGVEGALILLAAGVIIWTAIPRLITPHPLEQVGLGLGISMLASVINLGVARVLMRAGRERNSITLEANAHHLMTDVWTSLGVLAAIGLVALTGWMRLDPIIAILVACNIVWTGVQLLRRSVSGLMDAAIPAAELARVEDVLQRYREQGIHFHALRTRQAGARQFVSVHVLVPGEWTVKRGHQLVDQIEANIREVLPNGHAFTHLEAINDPAAWQDVALAQENDLDDLQEADVEPQKDVSVV